MFLKLQIFMATAVYLYVNIYLCFGVDFCLHPQGSANLRKDEGTYLTLTLKKETESSLKTSVNTSRKGIVFHINLIFPFDIRKLLVQSFIVIAFILNPRIKIRSNVLLCAA
jgi:hypothetical protein